MRDFKEEIQDNQKMGDFSFSRLKRTVLLGVKSLWLHRLRSFLTVLGIVFGVCSVIAMLAIGEGASYEAQEEIKKLGSQNIILESVKPTGDENVTQSETSRVLEYGLTYEDISRIKATIPNVTIVVPGRIIREYAWYQTRRVDAEIIGTVPWYPSMRNHPVVQGRFFSEIEMRKSVNVCAITSAMAQTLFPLRSPIGAAIRVGSQYYQVIGIMESVSSGGEGADSGSVAASSTSNQMFIPLNTAVSRFGETLIKRRSGSFEMEKVQLHQVTVKVANLEEVVDVSLVIRDIMERYHSKKDYNIIVPLEMLKQAERTKQIFNIVLGSIAAISLLVGGIGIMNIMLASVTERTREIGIRRALGAKKKDIVLQFLVETVILSGSGGVMGVILGITIPFAVTYFSEMQTIVTLWAPIIAFTISGIVGIVFGIYPALRAAEMDPVEALRHE